MQTLIEGSGLSSAAAEIQIKDQAGIVLSLFDDFTGTLVTGNELTPDTIGTVVAVNNQAPTSGTSTALELARAFVNLYSASMATAWPATRVLENAFVDACYLDNGDTKQIFKALFDENPALNIVGADRKLNHL